jgi:CDP-diacylglycerol--serine O-phosphatidyltransferase
VLPNLLTMGSLFCGFYAIAAVLNGRYVPAAVAILVSVLFDGLDGQVARLTHSTSRFGAEFDSLCDVVAFGVAPGMLVLSWALLPLGRVGWLVAFLYVACGALRLARFNVQLTNADSRYFRGLPITAAGCIIAATVLFCDHLDLVERIGRVILLFLMIVLAFLMVSTIRYRSLKDLGVLKRKPFGTMVIAVLCIVVVMAEPEIMIFCFGMGYLIAGPLNTLIGWHRRRVAAVPAEKKETVYD